MSQDKEHEIKLQFLEEAQEYLNNIESGLLGLSAGNVDAKRLDAVLRAAHSIKGGAAMMGFQTLSHLAHLLEDFFKVLKAGKSVIIDGELEQLFLLSVDRLRQIITINRQDTEVSESWLAENVNSIFEQLHDRIGSPQPEDEVSLLSAETGENMCAFLFESEVEACLQRLESVLADPEQPCLQEEFLLVAQELEGLGEMLELTAFSSLCQSIITHLEAAIQPAETIARGALQAWRRSQALVLIDQMDNLPTELELSNITNINSVVEPEIISPSFDDFIVPMESIESFLDTSNIESEAVAFISSLESISSSQEELTKEKKVTPELLAIPAVTVPSKPQRENINNHATNETSENTIRVSVKQLEQLSDLFGELSIERNGLDLQLKGLRNLISLLSQKVQVLEKSNFHLRNAYDQVSTGGKEMNKLALISSANKNVWGDGGKDKISNSPLTISNYQLANNQFDILEMDRYSELHLLSQEVMETIVQIQEIKSDIEINVEDTERTARELNRTAKLMQTNITKVRMRPISDLVGHFPRALRNMEIQYGKQVNLKVRGGGTLVDRSILDALNDPLMHLFRNAFDHGIEDPETRRKLGKPAQGTIEISATYRGNQTVITMRDDGSGIALDKVRAKAIQMGLDAADIASASDNELLDLIFEPGFSTAKQVTDLSGRGVGMDIVRTNLRQVRGEIQVDTRPGLGTTFTINVPFTLSVVRVLLVESDGMLLAFPTNAVEEMLLLQPEMLLLLAGKEILNWEGYMVPLIRLNEWLKFAHSPQLGNTEAIPTINQPTVLMIAQGDDLVGIQVDRYWGEQEVTIRQVEGPMNMPPGFSGCTILGDGRVVPLVDAFGLLRWIDNCGTVSNPANNLGQQNRLIPSESGGMETTISPKIMGQKNMVMVVDDSINVRRFLALTLDKAGYRVEQAKDGQDALEKLQTGLPIRAIVCDIEMPRLDGYGFLAHVKSDHNFQNIPVLMLTSRSGEKHRQMAMNLGATGYFSKPFKEQELLQTLESLMAKG